jgi:hypothetical protein
MPSVAAVGACYADAASSAVVPAPVAALVVARTRLAAIARTAATRHIEVARRGHGRREVQRLDEHNLLERRPVGGSRVVGRECQLEGRRVERLLGEKE